MESIKTATRIHPLMAAAAVSVVIVSLAGTAAITGLLPNSRATVAPAPTPTAPLAAISAPPMMLAAAPQQPYVAAPEPAPAPVVKHSAPRHVVHHKQLARNDYHQNYSAPAVQQQQQQQQQQQAPAAPNYVGIGVGAVVGGLLGNQVGGGNGKKLATVAGVIGGGMLGNQIANGKR
jgi:uncharacterized protein YcfJ